MSIIPRSSRAPFDELVCILVDKDELALVLEDEAKKGGTGLRPPVLIRTVATFRFHP